MTLSKQTLTRLPRIKKGLINSLTIGQIADICKVTEKTIDRDLNKFRASPLFEEWLREEWQRLHYIIITENPVEAYRQLTRLLGQTFTRRMEVKKEVTTKIDVDIKALLARYEEVIERAADRNLPEDNTREQVDTHQTQAVST